MHNFVVHSNESARRKSGSLGMDQVKDIVTMYVGNIYPNTLVKIASFKKTRPIDPPNLGTRHIDPNQTHL